MKMPSDHLPGFVAEMDVALSRLRQLAAEIPRAPDLDIWLSRLARVELSNNPILEQHDLPAPDAASRTPTATDPAQQTQIESLFRRTVEIH